MKKHFHHNSISAFALLYTIIFCFLFILTITYITTLTVSAMRNVRRTISSIPAYQLAQSGIEDGLHQLKTNPTPPSYQRLYLASGVRETATQTTPLSSPPTGNTSLGYYELVFNAFGNGTVKVNAFYPWTNSFLSVIMQAVPATPPSSAIGGYNVQQIGG